MSKIWKSAGYDTLKYYLDTINSEASDDLNDWEVRFIVDMERLLGHRRELSRAQEEKLEQIYAKYTK